MDREHLKESTTHAVILFDGVCNLCNTAVTFIIDRDPAAYFRFIALQSETGQKLLEPEDSPASSLDSIVLMEKGQYYTHSTAALRIARRLQGGWPLLYGFIILPKPLRDHVYSWIASNRYRWFGKTEACRLPTPELKQRFL